MKSDDILPPLTPELNVRDLEKSLEFYVGLLGFEIQFHRPESRFAAIARKGAYFMLEEINNFEAASDEEFVTVRKWNTGELRYPFGRGMNFLIHADDLEALYERILRTDYPMKLPVEERWYRVGDKSVGVKQFMLTDPDGFLLRFDKRIAEREAS